MPEFNKINDTQRNKAVYLGKTPDGRDRFSLDVLSDPDLEVQVGAS